MNTSVYILTPNVNDTKHVYFLASFRVAELNDHEKISLIQDIENSLTSSKWEDFKVSIFWQSGFSNGEFFIWNEEYGTKEICINEKIKICLQSDLKEIKLNKVFKDSVEDGMYQMLPMSSDLLERFILS